MKGKGRFSPSQVKGFLRPDPFHNKLTFLSSACDREASLLGNTARVKSRGNFAKTTRDRRVEISEVHHKCIKTLHFGNQVDGCLGTEFIAGRV